MTMTHNDNNNNELNRISVVKDLCIHYFESANLSLKFHHEPDSNISYQILRFIYKNTQNSETTLSFRTFYRSLIRSLDFGPIIWSRKSTIIII
jgi:hypothetical protein